MTGVPHPRLFTLEEANALIPTLEPLLRRLQQQVEELRALNAQLEQIAESLPGSNGHRPVYEGQRQGLRTRAEALSQTIQGGIDEVHRYGCELKGVDTGLLDFRAMRDGRVVYLCWRLGEKEIAYWHDLDTGFGGRQPL